MKQIEKHLSIAIISVVILSFLPLNVYAHAGKTDANGGHYDWSTGEYHYHHGYAAHQHYDMDADGIIDCPYDFDDKTAHGTGNSQFGISEYDYFERTTLDSSLNKSQNQKKESTGNNMDVSFWRIIERLFPLALCLLGIFFASSVILFTTVYIIHIPCAWIIRNINNDITEENREKISCAISSSIVNVVLCALFIPSVTKKLCSDPNMLAALLVIIVFLLCFLISDIWWKFLRIDSLNKEKDSLSEERKEIEKKVSKQKQEHEATIKLLQDKLAQEKELSKERFCATPYVKELHNLEATVAYLKDELAEKEMIIKMLQSLVNHKSKENTEKSLEEQAQSNNCDYLERIRFLETELESAYSLLSEEDVENCLIRATEISRDGNNVYPNIIVKVKNKIPPGIAFAKDGMPVYWKYDPDKPYGDYTVYSNERSSIYHIDKYCAGYSASKTHIFKVIDTKRPCQKCARGYFHFTTVPEWFTQEKE